jgi:hypothetical protein
MTDSMLPSFEKRMRNLKGVNLLEEEEVIINPFNKRGRQPAYIENSYVSQMLPEPLDDEFEFKDSIEDIMLGVVRSFPVAKSHRGNKINVSVLRAIFNSMELISVKGVMHKFGYGNSQASLYMEACKLTVFFFKRNKQ